MNRIKGIKFTINGIRYIINDVWMKGIEPSSIEFQKEQIPFTKYSMKADDFQSKTGIKIFESGSSSSDLKEFYKRKDESFKPPILTDEKASQGFTNVIRTVQKDLPSSGEKTEVQKRQSKSSKRNR